MFTFLKKKTKKKHAHTQNTQALSIGKGDSVQFPYMSGTCPWMVPKSARTNLAHVLYQCLITIIATGHWLHWCQWLYTFLLHHYNDVIMSTVTSQITSVSIVCSTVGSSADQRKQLSSAPLAFVWGIHRWPVNSPHKRPVTRKMLSFDDVIMWWETMIGRYSHNQVSMVPAEGLGLLLLTSACISNHIPVKYGMKLLIHS